VRTELTLLICAALALLAVQISRLPPPAPKRVNARRRLPPAEEPDRQEPARLRVGVRGSRESRLAWSGFACAAVAAVGHLVLPAANVLWIALFVVAIVSVPVAAVLSFGGSSRNHDDG
jgi:hypothetical protein